MEDQAEQHQKWWHKFIRPLLVVGIVTASMLIIALIVGIIGGYLFNWDWTGLSPYTSPPHSSSSDFQRGKTLWDWMQLLFIPVVLAVAGFWFNHRERKAAELRDENERKNADRHNQTEREIAQDNQHEAVLQEYIDKMSELLLHEKLRESQPGDEVRTIARVRTLSVLSRLNSNRKRTVFNFLLYASKMIMRPERGTKEYHDLCPGQRDCRYGEGPLQESEPASENAAPHPRAAAQKCCGDDYGSRPVARLARAIQCGWRQDHKQGYTPGTTGP